MKNIIALALLTISWLCPIVAAERPAHIDQEMWEKIEPYLIPDYHPAKIALDNIFSASRAIFNPQSMEEAGFTNFRVRAWSRLIVTGHPELPGYIIKTFLDVQTNLRGDLPEYEYWITRIRGVQNIAEMIDQNHWHHIFKVPNKWIYLLPAEPSPPDECYRKYTLLVEDDMGIFDMERNIAAWKSKRVTKQTLDALVTIVETLGLNDCTKRDNVPFCNDGRIAFIDTQTQNAWPIKYKNLDYGLSPELSKYWLELTKKYRKSS